MGTIKVGHEGNQSLIGIVEHEIPPEMSCRLAVYCRRLLDKGADQTDVHLTSHNPAGVCRMKHVASLSRLKEMINPFLDKKMSKRKHD